MYFKVFQDMQCGDVDFIGINDVSGFFVYGKVGQFFKGKVSVVGVLISVVNMVV